MVYCFHIAYGFMSCVCFVIHIVLCALIVYCICSVNVQLLLSTKDQTFMHFRQKNVERKEHCVSIKFSFALKRYGKITVLEFPSKR
jgi:hypothetical protein